MSATSILDPDYVEKAAPEGERVIVRFDIELDLFATDGDGETAATRAHATLHALLQRFTAPGLAREGHTARLVSVQREQDTSDALAASLRPRGEVPRRAA